MGCEQFGRQACEENNQTADRLARQLDTDDPNQSADSIRRELYDRPPALQVDLLERIQQYDQKGQGADLRIDPVIRQVQGPYGRPQYVDTGDREVVIDSEQGSDRIAILRGAPEQTYSRYPDSGYPPDYPSSGYPGRRGGFDPLSMITEMFIGGMLGGQFSRWNHQPRRDFWRDQGGQMWYPNPSGRWGHQRSNQQWGQPQWDQSQTYPRYDLGPSRRFYQSQDTGQWGGRQQPSWQEQRRWQEQQEWRRRQGQGQDQGHQMPDWMRRMQQEQQRRRMPNGTIPSDVPPQHRPNLPPQHRPDLPPQHRPDLPPNRTWPRADQPRPDVRRPDIPDHQRPDQRRPDHGRPDLRREPRFHIPEQNGGQPPRRELPRHQNQDNPAFRNGGRPDMQRREVPPRVVQPPGRVIPPHQQPGADRHHRQR